jgi:hypothetical protein
LPFSCARNILRSYQLPKILPEPDIVAILVLEEVASFGPYINCADNGIGLL